MTMNTALRLAGLLIRLTLQITAILLIPFVKLAGFVITLAGAACVLACAYGYICLAWSTLVLIFGHSPGIKLLALQHMASAVPWLVLPLIPLFILVELSLYRDAYAAWVISGGFMKTTPTDVLRFLRGSVNSFRWFFFIDRIKAVWNASGERPTSKMPPLTIKTDKW